MQQNINLAAQINNQSAFQTIPNQNNVNMQGYNAPVQGMQNLNQQINRIDTL